MSTIIINVSSVEQGVNAISEAAADLGGWGNISVVLIGDVDAKAEIFDRIHNLASAESLILQPGGYYRTN